MATLSRQAASVFLVGFLRPRRPRSTGRAAAQARTSATRQRVPAPGSLTGCGRLSACILYQVFLDMPSKSQGVRVKMDCGAGAACSAQGEPDCEDGIGLKMDCVTRQDTGESAAKSRRRPLAVPFRPGNRESLQPQARGANGPAVDKLQ